MNRIKLPCYNICVELDGHGGGSITSDLHDGKSSKHAHPAVNMLHSIILAHACAGISIGSPAYVQGVETAIDSYFNENY